MANSESSLLRRKTDINPRHISYQILSKYYFNFCAYVLVIILFFGVIIMVSVVQLWNSIYVLEKSVLLIFFLTKCIYYSTFPFDKKICSFIKCHFKLVYVRSMCHKNPKVNHSTDRDRLVPVKEFMYESVKKGVFPLLPLSLFCNHFTSMAHSYSAVK